MFAEFLNAIFKAKQSLWLLPYKIRSGRRIASYVKNNKGSISVNIGSGENILPGWLNGEVWPGKDTVYIDAAKRLPFDDDSVKFINCEHMIEHLGYQTSKRFLRECLRILQRGGVLRISTPDLERLISIYLGKGDVPSKDILKHHNSYHNRKASNMCEWFNDHMQLWAHAFLFDEGTLIALLEETDFCDVEKCEYGKSRHPELQNIERHDEGTEWMKHAYLMIFEAAKKG